MKLAALTILIVVDGTQRYDWPVSTGLPGYSTPSGTYTASSMNEIWYSKQWDDAPMPHAVFFTKEGHAIHGTNEVQRLGKTASHGCVRLSPKADLSDQTNPYCSIAPQLLHAL
jgi:lipoprotein-anchoring transpeptidase ErfK/SrfK